MLPHTFNTKSSQHSSNNKLVYHICEEFKTNQTTWSTQVLASSITLHPKSKLINTKKFIKPTHPRPKNKNLHQELECQHLLKKEESLALERYLNQTSMPGCYILKLFPISEQGHPPQGARDGFKKANHFCLVIFKEATIAQEITCFKVQSFRSGGGD